jgi:hypothetical protein
MKVVMDGYPVEIGDLVWSRARLYNSRSGWGTVVKIASHDECMRESPGNRHSCAVLDGEIWVKVQFTNEDRDHAWYPFPGGVLAEHGLARDLFWGEIAPPIPPPKPGRKTLPDLSVLTGPSVKKWRWLVKSSRSGIQPYDWVLTVGWYSSKEELMRYTNGIVGEPILPTEREFLVHID